MGSINITARKAEDRLKQFRRQRILVVGDLMLDRYLYGSVSRISPEAPVPIVAVNRETLMPGGASNVAWNVQALDARAGIAGILGRDHAGHELKSFLKKGGVDVSTALEFDGHPTTVKMRVIAERQQVVRVDFERRSGLRGAHLQRFCRRLDVAVRQATGVIIEDYDKGVVSQPVVDVILQAARDCAIPVGLDPKDGHELDLRGITVATPNRKEAFAIAGLRDPGAEEVPLKDKALLDVGRILLEKWTARCVIVTLGPHGMMLFGRDQAPHHVPTRAREVFDVSGAGDTVIATCVTALAAGAGLIEAAELANYAAGVVVGKLGTATCTPQELLAGIRASV